MKHTAAPRENKEPPSKGITTKTANLISMIHRKDDAYVGFYRKSETSMPCIAGIRTESMKGQFPLIAPDVIDQENMYFTVNGYWPGKRKEGKEAIGYLGRSEKFLRSLNACYVDLDVNRLPLFEKPDQPEAWQDWLTAKHLIERMAENGEIPQPSIYAKSGRGGYVFWLLKDAENPEQSPAAFQLDFYKRINRSIQERLKDFAPDPVAVDGARVLRVPNSKHKNGVTVQYQVNYCGDDKPPTYTLGDLAEWFEVKSEQRKRREYVVDREKGRGREGLLAVHRKRARDLERLARAKAIRQGTRRYALTVYSYALRIADMHPREAAEKLRQMARKCSPAYPGEDDDPVEQIVKQTYGMSPAELFEAGKIRHNTLSKRIGITADLAEELELETIVPDQVKRERREWQRNAPTKAQERREWLVEYLLEAMRENPSLRDLAKRAKEAGHKCTHETIRRDLKQIHGPTGMN